jgi:uncharacterized protein
LRIAVVGSGISGLAAAWLLRTRHDVHVFEQAPRIGGHTDTRVIRARDGRSVPIDTGFIVYNEVTYPLFVRLLDELGVATQPSDMSWALRCARCRLEYAGNPRGVLAQPTRAADPRHVRMLADIVRFHRTAHRIRGTAAADTTLGAFLADPSHRFGHGFTHHYLLPMTSAIWSSSASDVSGFPLSALLDFLFNHGLLGVRTHHPWRTIVGGSSRYLGPLTAGLEGRIHTATTPVKVTREAHGVHVAFADGSTDRFDAIVLATPADAALEMLTDADDEEHDLLGAWRYSVNDRWLHTDPALLPRREAARASWNYLLDDCTRPAPAASLSYHSNRLQALDVEEDVVVTLNPPRAPAPGHVIARDTVRHPVYSAESVASQARLGELNGRRSTYFAGAYHRWGFHEDGLWSAVRVAGELGVTWPQ